MVRHHGERDRRRGSIRHGYGRDGDQYIGQSSPEGRLGPKAHPRFAGGKPSRNPSAPPFRSSKPPKKSRPTSDGRDPPKHKDDGDFDFTPSPNEVVNELRDIGTESFTNYDASKYDDASSYVRGVDREHGRRGQIQSKYSEESDRLMVVSTLSHMAPPDFNKLRGQTSKSDRGRHSRDRSYGGGRMPRLDEDARASFIDEEDESTYGGTNYTGYPEDYTYSRGGYSSVMSKDTGLTGFTGVGTGLTEDYTQDDDTGYDTGYDSRLTDAYTAYRDDERTEPDTNNLMKEVKKEMKAMRRDWNEEKKDMDENFEDVQICDFSVLQKQMDKLVKKGKVSLVAMMTDRLNLSSPIGTKSPRGRGARRRKAWDDHLKNLDPSQTAQNESSLVSSASFTPSLGVTIDFEDEEDEAQNARGDPTEFPATDAHQPIKEDDTAMVSGMSWEELSRLDSDDRINANQRAPRPPMHPATHAHKKGAPEATMSPKHTTPDSDVLFKGGQMSVINPSADEDAYFIQSAKAALRKAGSGVAYYFHNSEASIDESVEVEAVTKGAVLAGTCTELITNDAKNQPPNAHLQKYANQCTHDSIANETSTTTVTLIKPSPSTSSLLKEEAKINGPLYQGPASGLPKETGKQTGKTPAQNSPTETPNHEDPSTSGSSNSGRHIKVTNGLRKVRKGKQAAVRPKKTVTEWLAGVQYEERKSTGTKWVKSKNSKHPHGSRPSRLPSSGAGRHAAIKKSTRKNGLKKDDDVLVELEEQSSVYAV